MNLLSWRNPPDPRARFARTYIPSYDCDSVQRQQKRVKLKGVNRAFLGGWEGAGLGVPPQEISQRLLAENDRIESKSPPRADFRALLTYTHAHTSPMQRDTDLCLMLRCYRTAQIDLRNLIFSMVSYQIFRPAKVYRFRYEGIRGHT